MKTLSKLFLLAAVMTMTVGCATTRRVKYPVSLTHGHGSEIELPLSTLDLGEMEWVSPKEGETAETVLVVAITIPSVLDGREFTIPLRRQFVYGVEDEIIGGLGSPGFSSYADGVTETGRGMGLGVSVSAETEEPYELSIRVHLSWTAADGSVGKADGVLFSIIGLSEEWALSETVTVAVTYRKPKD